MAASVLNQFIDIKILVSLSIEEDGAAVTGHLFQMVSLAAKDPEGCVRSNPSVDMDTEAFSRFFHCDPEPVKRSVEVLQKYGLAEVEDGRLYICALHKKKKSEADAAAGRAKHAQQVKEWRARQKAEKAAAGTGLQNAWKPKTARSPSAAGPVTETVNGSVKTRIVKPSGENPEPCTTAEFTAGQNSACDPPCDAVVNPDTDIYITDISHTSNISNRKIYHIASGGKMGKPKSNSQAANAACIAAAAETGSARPGKGMIPLSSLPKDLRQVVEAWNALHIKTFTGLTVYMRNKLQQLLRQYTPEDVLRAIGNIARSPFLLGQTEASKNWRITLGWVLKPENCAKLLSGQYETYGNDNGDRENAVSCTGYGAPREWCETYLDGHADMTPEERKAAYHAWLNPHNADLDEAAAILNVTY